VLFGYQPLDLREQRPIKITITVDCSRLRATSPSGPGFRFAIGM
jgi:hypothetical protein